MAPKAGFRTISHCSPRDFNPDLGKKNDDRVVVIFLGGEGEIRTRGELPHACFQDKYLKPLGHLSKLTCDSNR